MRPSLSCKIFLARESNPAENVGGQNLGIFWRIDQPPPPPPTSVNEEEDVCAVYVTQDGGGKPILVY
jgi:hypothetical protein